MNKNDFLAVVQQRILFYQGYRQSNSIGETHVRHQRAVGLTNVLPRG
jgi:hypothetical protein